jgi:hypothetical protein
VAVIPAAVLAAAAVGLAAAALPTVGKHDRG